jgi:GGDEF domain-containing protein
MERESFLDDEIAKFLNAHLENHHQRGTTPLSMAVFKVIGAKNVGLTSEQMQIAAPQIGTMLRSLVRVEDCAARLADDTFAVLFPGESARNAQIAADRIGEIIACTGFDGPEQTFTVILENSVVETTAAQAGSHIRAKAEKALLKKTEARHTA